MIRTVGPFVLEKSIGSGGFATVYLSRHSELNVRVALKAIAKESVSDEAGQVRLQREISLHRGLKHPFITELFQVYDVDDHYYLVLELVEGGSLLDSIKKLRKLDEDKARYYFVQLLSAVEYIHEKGSVAHRDLKCENVLIDRHDNIRIIDFGLSRNLSDGLFSTVCGSPEYAAPELLGAQGYTQSVDIWALGVILYAMVVGRLPFADTSLPMTLHRIRSSEAEYPPFLSENLTDLLRQLMRKDPVERIGIQEMKRHPWLAMVRWNELNEAVARYGRRTSPASPDPAVVEKMGLMGLDCRKLREALCDGEETELTMLYHILRREKTTDRMKGCTKFRPGTTESMRFPQENGNVSLGKRISNSPVTQAGLAVTVGNRSLPFGLKLNRLPLMSPTHAFRHAPQRGDSSLNRIHPVNADSARALDQL